MTLILHWPNMVLAQLTRHDHQVNQDQTSNISHKWEIGPHYYLLITGHYGTFRGRRFKGKDQRNGQWVIMTSLEQYSHEPLSLCQ